VLTPKTRTSFRKEEAKSPLKKGANPQKAGPLLEVCFRQGLAKDANNFFIIK